MHYTRERATASKRESNHLFSLSFDGYYQYVALVGNSARAAIMLNELANEHLSIFHAPHAERFRYSDVWRKRNGYLRKSTNCGWVEGIAKRFPNKYHSVNTHFSSCFPWRFPFPRIIGAVALAHCVIVCNILLLLNFSCCSVSSLLRLHYGSMCSTFVQWTSIVIFVWMWWCKCIEFFLL